MSEIIYTRDTLMKGGYPKIKKLGACSPGGEMTPFVWNGRLMRMELVDVSRGISAVNELGAGIRDVESGEILSYFGKGSYFHAAFVEDDTVYVTGVDRARRDTIILYETKDLKNWTSRDLLTNPDWVYFNSQIAKGPEGYVIVLESGPDAYPNLNDYDYPKKYVGKNGWSLFFAKSPDMVNWEFMDYEQAFSLDEVAGGPALKYSDGWFYLFSDCMLPRRIYTNYMYRTKDFKDWYVGYYNPIMMASDEDKVISPNYKGITAEEADRIKTAFHINNTDLDLCQWKGKTYINYLCGNQYGNYWMAEAICDMPMADFLKAYFE